LKLVLVLVPIQLVFLLELAHFVVSYHKHRNLLRHHYYYLHSLLILQEAQL